jgi:hypothetical protein
MRWSGPWNIVGRVWPRHGHRGRPLNAIVRRHVKTLVAVVLFGGLLPAVASNGGESRSVLLEFYPEAVVRAKSVEVCYTNDCELYETRAALNESAWDAVFLHQYFVVAPGYREDFRSKYSAHAKALLTRYGALCPRTGAEKRPSCLLDALAKKSRLRYATVKYDEGYRCQVSGSLTNPTFQGKDKCTKVKHAS